MRQHSARHTRPVSEAGAAARTVGTLNELGIGLHSYGFMDAAFKWLMLFMASQLAVIGVGLLPLHLWRSFRTVEKPPPSGSPQVPGTPLPVEA